METSTSPISTSPISPESVAERKKNDTRFRKRRVGLFKKAYELGKLCGADICLIVYRNKDYYVYKSKSDPLWPPPLLNLVGFYAIFSYLFY